MDKSRHRSEPPAGVSLRIGPANSDTGWRRLWAWLLAAPEGEGPGDQGRGTPAHDGGDGSHAGTETQALAEGDPHPEVPTQPRSRRQDGIQGQRTPRGSRGMANDSGKRRVNPVVEGRVNDGGNDGQGEE